MQTIIYLVRHSEPFKQHMGIEKTSDDILTSNKKTPLSIAGEMFADKISGNQEFMNLDEIWSSDYSRTMATAKYFAYRNGLKVNVDENLGERKHGVISWTELPENFELMQINDENYKIKNGESKKEVRERMLSAINNIKTENAGKRILIVGHSTSTAFLLSNWCEVAYDNSYKFNGIPFFDGKWKYCQTFKLTFENDTLIKICTVEIN